MCIEILDYKQGESVVFKEQFVTSVINENGELDFHVRLSNQYSVDEIDDICTSWENEDVDDVFITAVCPLKGVLDSVIDWYAMDGFDDFDGKNIPVIPLSAKEKIMAIRSALAAEIARIDSLEYEDE